MKKVIYLAVLAVSVNFLISLSSCKGTGEAGKNSADTGQNHASSAEPTNPADSGGLATTPTETGGTDTSITTHATDTTTSKPK